MPWWLPRSLDTTTAIHEDPPMTSSAAPGGTTEQATTPFGLLWAIKTSFVNYVGRMSDGQAYISAGASANDRNEIFFPMEDEPPSDAPDDADQAVAFRGDVRFSGHFGLLFVQVAQPRLFVRGNEGELTVVDPASKDGARLRLVTFTVAGPVIENGHERWDATEVRLAAEGVETFGDVYQAGEPFEPFTITLPGKEDKPE